MNVLMPDEESRITEQRAPPQDGSSPSAGTATSLSLLLRVRQRDASGWQRLVQLYSPLVHRWSVRAGLAEADVADVVQEVFLAVHQGIDSFRRDDARHSFRGWLYGITSHKVADQFRRQAREPQGVGGSDAQWQWQQVPTPLPDEPSAADQQDDEAVVVREALELVRGEFEDRTWRACLETAVLGRLAADVAADLGMSVGAVYVAKTRVLRRLREELEGML